MSKRWRIHPHDPQRVLQLERAANVPAVVAQLLLCRGIHDPAQAQRFLAARLSDLRPPEELPGALQAAELIQQAIVERRKIVVYGDYDVDGMAGTAILLKCLRLLGADPSYYVPHRMDEGYGLNREALQSLAQQGASLVVTVDCGITAVEEAQAARDLGLQLIITDHHALADRLPQVAAIVHPRLPGTAYPFGELCGAGVAFKLAWAMCQQASQAKKVNPRMKDFLLEAVPLAALGTVADVVPLVDENRILVTHGLRGLKEAPSLGLAMLMKVAGSDKKPTLSSEDIAFGLAPRLNAAGRMGQARLAVELLTTDSQPRATELAEYLNQLNESRQSLERSIYLAANKQVEEQFDAEGDAALVLAERGWHAGVIGIVAGRIAEKFHRPTVIISLDEHGVKPGVGSARGVPGFSLHEALAACSGNLLSHGGHAAAAGLKIDESAIEAFREEFREHASGEISHEQRVADLWIDAEAPLSALTMQAVTHIEQLAPFGEGNRRPLVCATGVELAEPPKRIGGGGRHLSLKVIQGGTKLRAVAFGGGDWADELANTSAPLSFAFRPIINDFNGRRTVELQIADWRVAEPVPT
ncbi:MAG: single-stranded-DNA-specific exonuclease RecJ [Pirellulales bacterium]